MITQTFIEGSVFPLHFKRVPRFDTKSYFCKYAGSIREAQGRMWIWKDQSVSYRSSWGTGKARPKLETRLNTGGRERFGTSQPCHQCRATHLQRQKSGAKEASLYPFTHPERLSKVCTLQCSGKKDSQFLHCLNTSCHFSEMCSLG